MLYMIALSLTAIWEAVKNIFCVRLEMCHSDISHSRATLAPY